MVRWSRPASNLKWEAKYPLSRSAKSRWYTTGAKMERKGSAEAHNAAVKATMAAIR
jgi:hypothetical protein